MLQGQHLEAARDCPELHSSSSAMDPPENTSEPFATNKMLYIRNSVFLQHAEVNRGKPMSILSSK